MTTLTSDVVNVTIQGISDSFEAKIDTGAEQASLHAEDIHVDGEHVIFRVGERVYRAPLETEQNISSADGGTASRPVIRAQIEIEGESIDTLINLNDRGEMPQPMLIGQDVIRAAGFTLEFSNQTEQDNLTDLEKKPEEQEVKTDEDVVVDPQQVVGSNPNVASGSSDVVQRVVKLTATVNALQSELLEIIDLLHKGSSNAS